MLKYVFGFLIMIVLMILILFVRMPIKPELSQLSLSIVNFSIGSGVSIDGDLYTAAHVIRAYSMKYPHHEAYFFQTSSGEEGEAYVCGIDDQCDIARMRFISKPSSLRSLRWSSHTECTSRVYTCSCAFALSPSFSDGLLAARNRNISGATYDQCSAPTFPGSSGGAVISAADLGVLGIIHGGVGETFTLYVPSRVIKEKLSDGPELEVVEE